MSSLDVSDKRPRSSVSLLDFDDPILAQCLVGTGRVLLLMCTSKAAHAKVGGCGARVILDSDDRRPRGLSKLAHMQRLLRGATALLRSCRLDVVLGGRRWPHKATPQVFGDMMYVCRLHGDCTHAPGDCHLKDANLRDLLELRALVDACPHFTCRLCVGGPEVRDSHFVLVVQPMHAHQWQLKLNVGSGGRKLREQPW
jgi:hypothetical protein